MVDTYTQALKARRIEPGGYDPDWSTRFNADVVDIFDAGISGQVDIDIGSATTYALPALQNGTLSTSHYWRLNFVGTPASAVTVTVPASVTPSKAYLVDNQTGQNLTIKYAATSGVTVVDGEKVEVFCDGTNVSNRLDLLFASNSITNDKIRDSSALSVIGRSSNSTGDPADISADATEKILIRRGTTLGFDYLYPRTAAEIAALITPTNYAIPSHDVCGYCDPLRYGNNTTPGTTPMTTAINAAIAVAKQLSQGGIVQLPLGDILITGTLLVDADRIHIRGRGKWATRVIFAPTANDVLFEFNRGASSIYQCSLRGLSIYSNDSTYTKTAVDLYDIRDFTLEDVTIGGSVVVGSTTLWSGANSIGVRTRGREFAKFFNVEPFADRPFVLSANPNDSRDADHFHWWNINSIANAHPHFEVEDTGLNLSNLTWDGFQSWNLGSHGFYWVQTVAPDVSSYTLSFRGVRTEQGTSAAAQTFHIEMHASATLQDLHISDTVLDSARDGIYLRRVEHITLDHVKNPSASNTALNITAILNSHLTTSNCLFNTGSTVTLSGFRALFGLPNSPAQNAFANGKYGSDANTTRTITVGGSISESSFTLANDAVQDLGISGMAGLLVVTTQEATAIFQIRGTSNSVTELLDPQLVFSHTAGTASSNNVYYSSGYKLENKRGGSRTYKITLLGSYNSF